MGQLDSANLLQILSETRLVAIIRGDSPQSAVAAARVLFDAGVRLVEIALTTPGTLDAIAELAPGLPEGSYLGAGTVLTEDDVDAVASAGAHFVVTPAVTESVAYAVDRGLPVLAGAFTPTEVREAWRAGAAAVKVFPASAVGPGYFKAVHDPFPDIPLLAVGGVGLAQLPEYLAAGAVGLGVGGPLVGDAARGGDLDALAERARAFVAAAARGAGARTEAEAQASSEAGR